MFCRCYGNIWEDANSTGHMSTPQAGESTCKLEDVDADFFLMQIKSYYKKLTN